MESIINTTMDPFGSIINNNININTNIKISLTKKINDEIDSTVTPTLFRIKLM